MVYPIHVLYLIAFVDLLAVGLIVPLVPNHVRHLGGNHIHVGLLGSLYAGFQFFSGPLIGSLSDFKGRKPILVWTLMICSISYLMLGLTNSVIFILFIRIVVGIFKQTQMLTKALVPDYEKNGHKQAEIYGKMAAISGVGITLGPVIGGHIAEDYPENGFKYVGFIVGACFVINSGFIYFLSKVTHHSRKKSNQVVISPNLIQIFVNSLKQSMIELYRVNWSIYWDIFLYKAIVGFAMGVYYSNYGLFLKSKFELSPKYIGYIISFQGVIGSVSCYFIGFINSFYQYDTDYSVRNFHVFILLCLSLFGLILSFHIFIYVVCLIPLAIGNAVARLVTLEMILNRCTGDHRGTLIGASNSVRSLSGVVAPMVAGFIGQFIGINYVIYASLCSTSIGLILSYNNISKLKAD